jgi:hypothetical protein
MFNIFASFLVLISLIGNIFIQQPFKEEIKMPFTIPSYFSYLSFCENSMYIVEKVPCTCNVPVNIYKYTVSNDKFLFTKMINLRCYLSENQWLNPISIKIREDKLYILCNSSDFIDREKGRIFNINVLYTYDAKNLQYLKELEFKDKEMVDFEVLKNSDDILFICANGEISTLLITNKNGEIKKQLNLPLLKGRCESINDEIILLAGIRPVTTAFSSKGSYGICIYDITNNTLKEVEFLKRELIYDFFILNSNEICYSTIIESNANNEKVAIKFIDLNEEKVKKQFVFEDIAGNTLSYDKNSSSIYLYSDFKDCIPLRIIKDQEINMLPILEQFEVPRDSYIYRPFLASFSNSSEMIIAEEDGYLKKFNISTKETDIQLYDKKFINSYDLKDINSIDEKIYLLLEDEIKILKDKDLIGTININSVNSPKKILPGKNELFIESDDKFVNIVSLDTNSLKKKYKINFDYKLLTSYNSELWALLPNWYIAKIIFDDANDKAYIEEKIKLFKEFSEDKISKLTQNTFPNFICIDSDIIFIADIRSLKLDIFGFDLEGKNILVHKALTKPINYMEFADFICKNKVLYLIDNYRGRILSYSLHE